MQNDTYLSDENKLIELAIEHQTMSRYDEAIAIYKKILIINSSDYRVNFLAGSASLQAEYLEDAIMYLENSLAINPLSMEVLHNLGLAYFKTKDFTNAKECFNKCIDIKGDDVFSLFFIGNVNLEENNYEKAITYFEKAINQGFDYYTAFTNIGNALKKLGKKNESIKFYKLALERNPSCATTNNNLSVVLKELMCLDEALHYSNIAVSQDPLNSEAWVNNGNIYLDLQMFEQSLLCYDKAIMINPNNANAYGYRALALQGLSRPDEALVDFNIGLLKDPTNPEIKWNKGLFLLQFGNFIDGWALYEARLYKYDLLNNYKLHGDSEWRGEKSLLGKTILITHEQGFGDSIQFCRYLPLLRELGAKVTFRCPAPLVELMNTIKPEIELTDLVTDDISYDYYCPLMSLPHAFKSTVETLPANIPYLFCNEIKYNMWSSKLSKSNLLRIGIAWTGNPNHQNDKFRSIPLSELEKLLSLPFEFHSLQKEHSGENFTTIKSNKNFNINLHEGMLNDFSDTAALIQCMDLIISVDTSIAHLAGAMGKTLWVMLPLHSDYRWLKDRTDSPWYPTAKIYRQIIANGWSQVIDKISNDLMICYSHVMTH